VQLINDPILTQWQLPVGTLESIASYFREESIHEGDYFIREGNNSAKIGYVLTGQLKTFYRRGDEEIIRYFSLPSHWIGHFESFEYQKQTPQSICAVTDTQLLTITTSAFNTLINTLPLWKTIWETIKTSVETQRAHAFKHLANERERYLTFIETHPDLALNLSPEEIAQYLVISHQRLLELLCEMIFVPKTPQQ